MVNAQRPPCIVIVDAFSSGKYLAREHRRYGLDCVHVTAQRSVPEVDLGTFIASDFSEDIPFMADPAALAGVIASRWTPIGVVLGTDVGVTLADALAAHLGVPGNDPATSARRRDKYEMTNAVARASALTARQHLAHSVEEAAFCAADMGGFPLVVKPVAGSGSHGVSFCRDLDDVARAAERVIGHPNVFGDINTSVLVQTYLDGPQYVLNAVSRNGRHAYTDIWRIVQRPTKTAATITSHKVSLMPGDPALGALLDYTSTALTACGIEHGPSHTEVRLTAAGPALVEINPRLMGASIEPEPFLRAFGTTQPRLVAQSLLEPSELESRYAAGYAPRARMALFHLNVPRDGVIQAIPGAPHARAPASFQGFYDLPKVGTAITSAGINIARAGYIYLIHEDDTQLHKDIQIVQDLVARDRMFAL